MAFRMGLFFLMVAVAATAAHGGGYDVDMGTLTGAGHAYVMEMDEEMMMESESEQRQLGGSAGYISYAALARNRVPCDQRGASYYNCYGHQRANPYNRGCTRATNCARTTR